MKDVLAYTDFRRQVASMYDRIRMEKDGRKAHTEFTKTRDRIFKQHKASALTAEQKETFSGLDYFPYDSAYRFFVTPNYDVHPEVLDIKLRDDGVFHIRRVARLTVPFSDGDADLTLFWIEGYGGGLFLPFSDKTNSDSTYGGGRYLLDTIKHADLGAENGKLILDFNFSYNPSCAYNSLWDCPLAPFENKLELPIKAGEKRFGEHGS